MKVMVDTCISLDFIHQRQQYFKDAKDLFAAIADEKIEGYVSVKSLVDIHYVTKHILHDEAAVRAILQNLLSLLKLVDSRADEASKALVSNINDYEDALMVQTAAANRIDYIVTRNVKDYKNSPVKAVSPADMMAIIKDNF